MNLNAKWFLSPIREKCFIDSQDRRKFYIFFPPRRGRIVENEERKENTREENLQALDCQLSPGRWRNFRRGNSREGGSRCIGTERYTGEKDVLGAPRAGSSVQIFYMGGWHNGQVSGLALRTFCRSFHKEGRTPPPPFVNREGFTTRLTFLLEYASTQSIRSNPSVTLDNVWNRCLKRG